MEFRRRKSAPKNERGGQESRLLFAPELGSTRLAVTWVHCKPRSQQEVHVHAGSEQIYVIVRGQGLMLVDDETLPVEAGDAILIPPGAAHAIRNISTEILEYISATAPPFPVEINAETWKPG